MTRNWHWEMCLAVSFFVFPWNQAIAAQDDSAVLSKSFEFRYFSNDPAANGETDFKGETAVFDTDQRLEYLAAYADYAKDFFGDQNLDKKVVSEEEVQEVISNLKPQPLPEVRKRIVLDEWKWQGYRKGQLQEEKEQLQVWDDIKGLSVKDGRCIVTSGKVTFDKRIKKLGWRFFIQFDVKPGKKDFEFTVSGSNGDAGKLTLSKGAVFYASQSEKVKAAYETGQWYTVKLEVDLENQKYNVYINDQLAADFVPLANTVTAVDHFTVTASKGVELDNIWGVGYERLTESPKYPYSIKTFIDQDFEIRPCVKNWNTTDYNDRQWQTDQLPIVHGGERYKKEDLYLRKTVKVADFTKAYLNVETIDPSGEIWINGTVVAVLSNRQPAKIDITRYLNRNAENLIAIKVDYFKLSEHNVLKMPHSSTDDNIGWFAGRISIDLVEKIRIDDVFVYAIDVQEPAKVKLKIRVKEEGFTPLKDDENYQRSTFNGSLQVKFFKWHPQASEIPAAVKEWPIQLLPLDTRAFEQVIEIPDPELWDFQNPNLYKVQVVLKDGNQKPLDDFVVTSGIRTVSQDGGTFRINGKPEMINGAQLMGYRAPLDRIATWSRCAPAEWIVKEILANKKTNGNGLKMQIHQWQEPARGINDPRFAEIGDQLGFMYIWPTTAWMRTGSPWGVDFDGYPKYMQQVYNHPSIVMWLTAGHPRFPDKAEADRFYKKVHQMIYPIDPSRLIAPNEFNIFTRYGNDEGTIKLGTSEKLEPSKWWTAKNIVRGNQDAPLGYGNEWNSLRKWPNAYRQSLLDSAERAYFAIEHGEATGQPNWNLMKGKPFYHVHSYEMGYDTGSIGRVLDFSEWQESQAWQALLSYESTKKERIYDYDGFSWCCLHGGGNTATYKKPLIDFLGHAKLSWYTTAMSYQRVLAGSDNVDIVYGPDDTITPVIMNLDDAKKVELIINIYNQKKSLIKELNFPDITLEEGRSVTKLEPLKIDFPREGYYGIEYTVIRTGVVDKAKTNIIPSAFKQWLKKSEVYVPVYPLTKGPKHHWFGYYDKYQTDPSDRYVLSMKVDFEHRSPESDDTIKIGMVDRHNDNEWIELGSSRAWNWQQGCMLQWRPGHADEVLWNDREGDKFVCHIMNIKTMTKRTIPSAVYNASPDGKFALSLDFERIQDVRAGYGYAGITDKNSDVLAPDNAGIYKISLDDGSKELIVSLKEVAAIAYPLEDLSGYKHYFNHIGINPDGSRFVFLHRWIKPEEGKRTSPLGTRFMSASVNGGAIHVLNDSRMTSHFWWKNSDQILAWANRLDKGDHFYLFDDAVEQHCSTVGDGVLIMDGHCSFLPNKNWILTDTYPDENRQITLYLFNTETQQKIILGKFFVDEKYTGEWRVDLHPRQSRDGEKIFVDSPINKDGRQILMLDISNLNLH